MTDSSLNKWRKSLTVYLILKSLSDIEILVLSKQFDFQFVLFLRKSLLYANPHEDSFLRFCSWWRQFSVQLRLRLTRTDKWSLQLSRIRQKHAWQRRKQITTRIVIRFHSVLLHEFVSLEMPRNSDDKNNRQFFILIIQIFDSKDTSWCFSTERYLKCPKI